MSRSRSRFGRGAAALVIAIAVVTRPVCAEAPPERVLIVAPHPDDESLCCGGLIRQTLQHGGSVAIVWITSGDAFELDAMVVEHTLHPRAGLEHLAVLRMAEARRAAATLGVSPDNQYFLGYPDRGLRRLLLDHYDLAYRSTYTHATAVPYAGALTPGADYTGRNLERDLLAVMTRFNPTRVVAPSPEDVHADHRATAELTIRLLAQRQQLSLGRYWIVHGGEGWPTPRGLHRERASTLPPVGRNLPWQRLALGAADMDAKLAAIRTYRSQLKVMERKMLSYVRSDELYTAAPLPE